MNDRGWRAAIKSLEARRAEERAAVIQSLDLLLLADEAKLLLLSIHDELEDAYRAAFEAYERRETEALHVVGVLEKRIKLYERSGYLPDRVKAAAREIV